ncbi:MAG TPA: translation initiation factor IF-2 [Gemmatimonadaceae bacterium]|nr:translation initiation factor IF-2 [Gemmatimonadaceae bacterium]
MIKLRVHDLAGEFGISSDELMNMLRQMDVPVRSHLSQLSDDQVARLRARWERDKRARAAKPAPSTRRRRGASAPKTATKAAPAPQAAPPAAEPAAAESAVTGPAGVKRRRRKAADVAAAEAAAQEAAAQEAAAQEAAAAAAAREEAAAAERAAAAQAAAAALESARRARSAAPRAEPPESRAAALDTIPERADESAAAAPPAARPAPPAAGAPAGPTREPPRPRPVVPGPPRPKPVASSTPQFTPARPIASAAPGGAPGMASRREEKRGKRKKGRRGSVDQQAVSANITRTMSAIRGGTPRRSGRRAEDTSAREEQAAMRAAEAERERKTVRVNEFITVSELAEILKVPASEIVGFAFKTLGLVITINQRLDFDQIELIAGEFGFEAMREEEYAAPVEEVETDSAEDLVPRPPVVTIMGHVDHGKTSLLDYIRKANVVAGESGGITQHIGAYHVTLPRGREITFLDTPGHEAFTAMRARGAQVTDIVVLVVAADDQVMPQTVEAISHAKNAGVPIVVAINKIDLPTASVPKVKQELLQYDVVLEEFGGTTLATPISAKKGTNVEELLEQILLQAEILDLRANPKRHAQGTVVEAQLDPGKGPVATVLVQSGTLRVGDDFICGMYSGRVRALLDERGKQVTEAGPAIPVQVLGIEGVPQAGDRLLVLEDSATSREIAQTRQRLDREAKSRRTSRAGVSLEDLMTQAATDGERRTLQLLIKADQGGPAEALADALGRLSTSEVQVDIVHRGVGAITESDILLAKAAGAIIIGFHVRPDNNARAAAEREGVEIRLYRVIYDAVNEVRAALEGMLRPEEREVVLGEAEVRELFRVPRVGVVAGCSVRSGVINRGARVRVVRDGVEIYDGTIASLRRFKEDVREVREGFECGIAVENFNDVKVGDVIECYRTEEVARTLAAEG